jgi:hypothetical protein
MTRLEADAIINDAFNVLECSGGEEYFDYKTMKARYVEDDLEFPAAVAMENIHKLGLAIEKDGIA